MFPSDSFDTTDLVSVKVDNATDLLTKNTLTTAGVLVGAGTGVAALALVASALPAQVALATALSGGLVYVGDRQDKGLPVNPWASKDEVKTETKEAEAPAAA